MPIFLRWLVAAVAAVVTLAVPAAPTPGPTRPRPPNPLAFSIMPVGDSITIGAAGTTGTGYRGYLAGLVPLATWVGSQGAAPLRHEGHSGWTCDQLADQARAWAARHRPRMVLLDCGTNDDGLGRSAEQMLASAARLLDELAAGGARTVLVAQITITPYNTPAQQQAEIDFNAGLPALAAARTGVRVVDMTGVHLSPDRVHPDDEGYAEMARRWAAALPTVWTS